MKILIPILIVLLYSSCNKEKFTNSPDARLQSSADTLSFDTVFTTTGSITQSLKIINNNERGIHVSSVKVGGGPASAFKINVNGQPVTAASIALDIAANDSAYVFVTVHINPTAANLPFIVQDSVLIEYNNTTTVVQLKAYGQNAHFLKNRTITGNETWTNELPYVIVDKLTIAQGGRLSITKGCRIYIHANAPIVVNGSLQVKGEAGDSAKVVFTGDRLDDPYRDFPASWPGIYFSATSANNRIEYAVIKNAFRAIVLQNAVSNPALTIKQTIIDNAYDAGIASDNSGIAAQNLLVSNCGKNIILRGGNYTFTHCTAASYNNIFIQHKDPVLYISNATALQPVDLNATFRNCIFWGEGGLIEDEVVTDTNAGAAFNAVFDHILWKQKEAPANATANTVISNEPPLFDSINTSKNYYSFKLQETSPAINKGVLTSVTVDLEGKQRPVGLPDLGCYEKQ